MFLFLKAICMKEFTIILGILGLEIDNVPPPDEFQPPKRLVTTNILSKSLSGIFF